ncbi:MAG: indolepyruvate ferredoxin oxidoreductase subunit alpha [Desulfurococcales archaeon]|nr:indolepyruvate ferredoxin oxidoreductase subunit alpha [Desulfurococcales archaeon]
MPSPEVLGPPGAEVLLLGNEAIARGALEAGLGFASAYPGTPSTEIVETLASVAKKLGIYVEWSTNEKVALEAAFAASASGVRALAAMKHVGLNVAADAFMSISYVGVRSGLLIVSAEDPSMWSSQNEQDNRFYGMMAYVPVFEPHSPAEAKEMAATALDFSEKLGTPILMTPTTRVSHTRGPVKLGQLRPRAPKGYFKKDPKRFTLIPAHARERRKAIIERWMRVKEAVNDLPFNRVEGSSRVVIVASGISYAYVREAVDRLGLDVAVAKVGTPVPLPARLVREAIAGAERVLVVEELEPVVEMQLKDLVASEGLDVEVHGKDYVGYEGEMTLDRAARAILEFMGKNPLETPWRAGNTVDLELPERPPAMCPGCPHRATYFALRKAVNSLSLKAVYSGDIGCYSLGVLPPFQEQDLILEMGGSIGAANGLARVAEGQVAIAIIGDSTFYHAGLPALANAVYNGNPLLVLVMDNRVTAMTGEQPNPSTGITAMGEKARWIPIEDVARGLGVEKVVVFDPYNLKEAFNALRDALKYVVDNKKPAVAVARRACSLYIDRIARRRGVETPLYAVVEDKCTACGICYNAFTCPAIMVKSDGKAWIDPDLCTGCGVCAQVCPFNAIVKVREGSPEWEKLWF